MMFDRSLNLISLCFILFWSSFAQAQSTSVQPPLLSGVLLDGETREPVPYANLVIDGSHVGTSSAETGVFYLQLNARKKAACLRVSSIGYLTRRLTIDSLLKVDSIVIYLKPAIIELDEVLVQSSRFSAADFVREAIQSLDKNTYQKDYLLEWYSNMQSTDSATDYYYSMETVFADYHIDRVAKRTIRQQRERGISPILVQNPADTICELVPWFDIGVAEINNVKYGVFNLNHINDFAFTYNGVLGLDDDSVYVIGYEAISRSYDVTGITNKNIIYRGKIYIGTKDNAVLRHTLEVAVKARKHEQRGWHFIKEEVLYKKISGYYFPYYIKSTRNLDVSRNFNPFHSNTYILRDVSLHNIEYEAGYNWCDHRAPDNETFWNSNYPRQSIVN